MTNFQQPSPTTFLEALEREILSSNLLRARVLAGLFGVGVIAALLTRYTPGLPPQYAFGSPPSVIVIGAIVFLFLYELSVQSAVKRTLKAGREPSPWVWYANAFIELSIPSLTMLLIARELAVPPLAIATPAVLAYFGFIALSTLRLDPAFSVFTGLVAALQYLAVSIYLLWPFEAMDSIDPLLTSMHFPVQRAVILAVVGVGSAFVASELRRRVSDALKQVEEKQRILTLFGQQTSPEVAKALMQGDPPSSRFVCVMFVDVRGFSGFAEEREPAQVVEYLNKLFEFSIEAVHVRHGHVHQLLGDGFMAIFGAPESHGNDCGHAVEAALDILRKLDEAVAAGRIEPTVLGIGIHAGEAWAGAVGSSLHREYKVTGDTVNVAARVEELTKTMNASLIITESVWDRLDGPRPVVLERKELPIRGRQKPVVALRIA